MAGNRIGGGPFEDEKRPGNPFYKPMEDQKRRRPMTGKGYHPGLQIFCAPWILLILLFLWSFPAFSADKDPLATINPAYLISAEEAQEWHVFKDQGGPTYSGSPAWKRFLGFLEDRFRKYGVVDIQHNTWTYPRWYTSDFPDTSKWALVSDGRPVKVASYGAYSGSTSKEGISAELAFYNPAAPPESFKGKIVVFTTVPHPNPPFDETYKKWFTLNDYEYRTSDDFPPLFTQVPPSESVSYDVWWQLRQTAAVSATLKKIQAAAGIMVFNMGYDRLAGLYTFPVPTLSNIPVLYVDKEAGAQVIQDAKAGKKAVLKLEAAVEQAETFQWIGFLPGKDYGTEKDERILLITHTDGPCLQQDNGALGILGIVAYFSRIPQAQRPKTLMVFLDNRHYMPGMEKAFEKEDYFTKNPEARKKISGLIGIEHLGQIEYRERDGRYEPTGKVEGCFLWTRNHPQLIEAAVKAAKDHRWPRVMVQCVERPGIHGGTQGVWYGMGKIALDWDLPAFATMGTQGAYWATTARIHAFDKNLFRTQVAAMAQLTGTLMKGNYK